MSKPEIKIVVLDRGFIYVGEVTYLTDSIVIDNAQCIRRWGTTKGLGELCAGPTKETILEPSGAIEAPIRAVIFTIKVDQTPWMTLTRN